MDFCGTFIKITIKKIMTVGLKETTYFLFFTQLLVWDVSIYGAMKVFGMDFLLGLVLWHMELLIL
jgi:hypothetical protein